MAISPISVRHSDPDKNRLHRTGEKIGLEAIEEIVDLAKPKAILVCGLPNFEKLVPDAASWQDCKTYNSGNNPDAIGYAHALYRGQPIILSKHFSLIGAAGACVTASLAHVKRLTNPTLPVSS